MPRLLFEIRLQHLEDIAPDGASSLGYEVIATDASPDMLMEAQNKAYDNEQSIMFLCQRMEETDLYGTVRAVVCALDSINHLPDYDTMAKTFDVLKNFVDDGGIMVFDVNNAKPPFVNAANY